jgi:hypothetical protein
VVHEDLAHEPGRNPEEMRPVLPAHLSLVDQPQIRFVDQSRGLQDMAGPLLPHVPAGNLAQFVLGFWSPRS